MPSIQARHARRCASGRAWSTYEEARTDCTYEPTYYVVVREGRSLTRERVGKNRRAAERALRKIGTQVDEGEYRAQKTIRFAEWAERWLRSLEGKETTRLSYRSTISYAVGAFGEKQVRRIAVDDVVRLMDDLRDRGLSASTRAKHLRVLGACLSSAASHGYAGHNPARRIPRSERPRPVRREAGYFQNDELPALLQAMTEGVYRVLVECALSSGMRQGELLALSWGDLDLTDAVARVRRNRTRGITHDPKNHEQRDVDLTSGLVERLGGWWGELGRPDSDVLVFPGAGRDGHLDPTTVTSRELYGAMRRAGIPRVGPTGEARTFHSLRHTYAKRALEAGAQISWLSRQLGHSSIVVTLGVYGHWERAERKRQAQLIEDAYGL